ncbi:efflux transporter outer membrane subunit [Oxalobacteraceae bacterium CAVE-383]|nr:efflux transporter outer membrane subunit [Oxalobacteraceae bacterium CAVE-383]
MLPIRAYFRSAIAVCLTLALGACASMGNIHPESNRLDPNALGAGSAIKQAASTVEWPRQQWWEALHDNQLNELLRVALADNPGLRGAQARVRQAQAIAGIAEQNTKPKGEANASLNRELYSANGTTPAPLAGNYAWRNQATLSGSYDLDLWGKNRDALAAALDDIQLASAESQMARLTLETAIVRSYIQLSLQFDVQDILRETLTQRERLLDITQRRQQAGLATAFDTTSVEATLPIVRRDLEKTSEAIQLLRNQLAALSGKGPADGERIARPSLALHQAIALPNALPAELIGRRPDIVAQRWRVEAAAKRIQVAKADFYPNINLLAFVGFQSFGFPKFLDTNSQIRGIAPAISLPIFSGDRLRGQLGSQTSQYDAAVEQYNTTVVQALNDIADTLVKAQSLQQQDALTIQSLQLARRARLLAEQAYRAGLTDSINAIGAEVALLNEQQQTAQIDARKLDSYVSLMAALGGGTGDANDVADAGGKKVAALP